jgi:hypothetical protein
MDDDADDGVKETEKTEAQKQLDAQRRAEAAQRIDSTTDQQVQQPRPDSER